jgi:hypothetical protein
MKTIVQVVIFFISILQLNSVVAQVLLPPRNIEVNPVSLIANWQPPISILLDENFEGPLFPPVNWQVQSEGQGWFASNNGGSVGFQIPPHTHYAVANDHLAGINNNGIYDFLMTPALDLSQFNEYVLSFNSFYTGDFDQIAAVEISIDDGLTWNWFFSIPPSSSWEEIKINLSGFSGNANYSSVKIAFHAEADYWGSGWAVDDIRISSEAVNVTGYHFFVGDSLILNTTGLSCNISPSLALFGDTVVAHVAAECIQGISLHDTAVFISHYLMPPKELEASSAGEQVHLAWIPPADSTAGTIPENLLYYNVYRDDQLLIAIDKTSTEIWLTSELPGNLCYEIAAVYDLTIYGFAGQQGESVKDGPVCIPVNFGFELPFTENWDAGQYGFNQWTATSNWVISNLTGIDIPSSSFQSSPVLTAYDNSLESYFFNSTTIDTSFLFKIWLDFDLMLSDKTASASEVLAVEIWDGTEWITKKEFKNEGSFAWEHQHINITTRAKNRSFKIRFRAKGDNSAEINSWNIDNIHVYYDLLIGPPLNLTGNTVWPGRKVRLNWEPPSVVYPGYYFLDDGSSESGVSDNQQGESWIGNEFQYEGDGILQSASIQMQRLEGVYYSIDVFDKNKILLGSSDDFTPNAYGWTTVSLPDIDFSGTFYLMVHKYANTYLEQVYLDQNGPNASTDPARYFDGDTWWRLTDFNWPPSVCLIRAYGLIGDQKSVVAFDPGIGNRNPVLELSSQPKLKIANTPVQTASEKMPVKSAATPGQYEIYRRNIELGVYPWIYGDTTDWIRIGNTSETTYLDPREDLNYLGNMINEYYVTAVYSDTVSVPSNIATILIYEGIDDQRADGVKAFPNPASEILTIEMSLKVESISVFDIFGAKLGEFTLKGQPDIRMNVSDYPPGIYSLKFTTANGESFSRKFVKL